MPNNRLFYAVEQLKIFPDGVVSSGAAGETDYLVHGLQTLGMDTRFNLDPIFEIGQLAVYELSENLADISITAEKVLDGYPLLWHLATPTATSGSLVGRSAIKATPLLSLFPDTQNSASGTPISEVECSGMFVSQLQYQFPTEGAFTESVTFVGNNKQWRTSSFGGSGLFTTNADVPAAASGVQRRQDILFGSGTGKSVLPPSIPGISGANAVSGYHLIDSGNGPHIQSISVSCSLGREAMLELGRKGPYFRYAQFPTQVQTTIGVYCLSGDRVTALETNDSNVTDECIRIKTNDGTVVDCGNRNRLQSVSHQGGNAGQNGGNVICQYEYSNYSSELGVYNSGSDPAGLVSPF
jgi:hypothetical protein